MRFSSTTAPISALILVLSILLNGCTDSNSTFPRANQQQNGGTDIGEEPDDSPAITIHIADAEETERDASASLLVDFNITLNEASANDVSVEYTTVDGTAVAGSDYQSLSGTVTFSAGQSSKFVRVRVIGDDQFEGTETFQLQLSNPQGAELADDSATGTIFDDDPNPAPKLTVQNATVNEVDNGSNAPVSVLITLDAPPGETLTVSLTTVEGSATAGEDYLPFTGDIEFSPTAQQAQLELQTVGDNRVEPSESFILKVVSTSGPEVVVVDGEGEITIIDQDTPPKITVDGAVGTEGTDTEIAFTVSLDRPADNDITVDYAATHGTATKGEDYSLDDGQATVSAGQTSTTFNATITDDDEAEGTESFTVTISNPSEGEVSTATANGTILDDEEPPAPSSRDPELVAEVPTADRCDMLDPEYCLFPWPNNWFTAASDDSDTGLLLNLNIASTPKNTGGKPIDPTEWNRNDGFSPGQMTLTVVPGLTDHTKLQANAPDISDIQKSLRPDSPVFVIDALSKEFHPIWVEVDSDLTKYPNATPPPTEPGPALVIRPAHNFEEGREYIVVMQNMLDDAGVAVAPSAAFATCRDGLPTQLPQVQERCDDLEPKILAATEVGARRQELFLVWSFTVASQRNLSERVLHIRDQAFADLGDSNLGDLVVEGDSPALFFHPPVEINDGRTLRRIRGRVTVPLYLNENGAPGSTYNYEPGAGGVYDDGLPDQALGGVATWDVPFACSINAATYNGAESVSAATGYTPARPSLYGHGLVGARDEGNTYNGNVRDMGNEHNLVFCMVDWIGMATGNVPDDPENDPNKWEPTFDVPGGDISSIAAILGDVSLFNQLADRVQQGMLNFMFLGRAMIHPEGFCANELFQFEAGNPETCILDTTELFYDGNSQGGIIGGALLATSPDLRAGVLGVPGMNYSTLLRRSVDFDTYAIALYQAYPAGLDQSFVLSLMQNLWDRAESNGYAHHIDDPYPNTPAKRALLHPAFADHQVTMWAAEVQARTYGARLHCPGTVSGAHPAFTAQGFRHPDDQPESDGEGGAYWGFECLDYANDTHTEGSALIVWDSGPEVGSPPRNNVPPRPENGFGRDPHSDPRSDANGRVQKSEFLKVNGRVANVCGEQACSNRGFDTSE